MSVRASYANQALAVIREAKQLNETRQTEIQSKVGESTDKIADSFLKTGQSAETLDSAGKSVHEVLDGTRDVTSAAAALGKLDGDMDWTAALKDVETQAAKAAASTKNGEVLERAEKGLATALKSDLPNINAIISRAVAVLTGPESTPEEKALAESLIALRGKYGPNQEVGNAKSAPAQELAKVQGESNVDSSFQPDFVAVGMGPTGMMSMLAAIAKGRSAAGVEIRGEPLRGVHMNIREDWYHLLGQIDQLVELEHSIVERYGEEAVPKMPNGEPFKLADFFYNDDRVGGALDFPDIYGKGDKLLQNIAGRLLRISFEDARDSTKEKSGGKSQIILVNPPDMPKGPDTSKLLGDMAEVLDSPSTFQAALINFESIMRAYLHQVEAQDAEAGRPPRVKIYTEHRVVNQDENATGYVDAGDDNRHILLEKVATERNEKGKARRIREPGSSVVDLGVPTKFALTSGFGAGPDAKTLGYEQHDVTYTGLDGEEVVARQTWIAGEVTANVGGQLIRRISTQTDPKTGEKETVRQIAVGHENAPNVAWTLVQVPDFVTFDPVEAGLVPEDTDPKSKEYFDASQSLVYDYYVEQAAEVMHIPAEDIEKMRMFYGPNMFTLTERVGDTARLTANGVVAGDLMGNGHFLTSGGAMTGMIGHHQRFLSFWDDLDSGVDYDVASKSLEDGIRKDTQGWLDVSHKEFLDVSPINFGAERAAALGLSGDSDEQSKSSNRDIGLGRLLATNTWAESFNRLRAGEFGKPHEDFYVPNEEVDVTADKSIASVHGVNSYP